MALIDYEILIPSRRMVNNAPKILKLLPTARIYVDERERSEYVAAVGVEKVVVHPPTKNICEVMRHMLTMKRAECVVRIDDDLVSVISMIGRRSKKITDAGAILQIIENGINVAVDLGLKMFFRSPKKAKELCHKILRFRIFVRNSPQRKGEKCTQQKGKQKTDIARMNLFRQCKNLFAGGMKNVQCGARRS
jgi:hypothetical protein